MKHFTHQELSSIVRGHSYKNRYKGIMIRGQKKSEIILYVVLWAILFAAPVVSALVADFSVDWEDVWNAWGLLAMFCITFFIHNFFIAPLLVYDNRKWAFGSLLVLLFVCFFGYQVYLRPHRPEPRMDDGDRQSMVQKQQAPLGVPRDAQPPHELLNGEQPPRENGSLVKQEDMDIPTPPLRPENGRGEGREPGKKHEPPRAFGGQDSVAFIIMALLLGLNVGTKYFFKSLDDKKKIKELERENLNRQLEYLKYQINPHFFMNTLNNIHALVGIDPEQVKTPSRSCRS